MHRHRTLVVLALLAAPAAGQVSSEVVIGPGSGGFTGALFAGDSFGNALAAIGDLDGDGVEDLAVGSPGDGGGPFGLIGGLWILFMNANGTVKAQQEVSSEAGGLVGIDGGDAFGGSIAALGDPDGDGCVEIAVGAGGDATAGFGVGSLWILSLNSDGTVRSQQRITTGMSGFTGTTSGFGSAVAPLRDLDGNGAVDLAVGASTHDVSSGGLFDSGAVWILFMNSEGKVESQVLINEISGGFSGDLKGGDLFGCAVAALGDVDGNGVVDLAVGARGTSDAGPTTDEGAVWILCLNADGTVASDQKIGAVFGGFGPGLAPNDAFGSAVAGPEDLDGDGVPDLLVGAFAPTPSSNDGSVWVVFLEHDGSVRAKTRIAEGEGGFVGPLLDEEGFGLSVGAFPDFDGDGRGEFGVGSIHGPVHFLFADCVAPSFENVRPGDPPNPGVLLPGITSGPVLGAVWDPQVSSTLPLPAIDVLGVSATPTNLPSDFGTLLCGVPFLVSTVAGGTPFALTVPHDCAFAGIALCAQGARLSGSEVELTNALDIVIGTF